MIDVDFWNMVASRWVSVLDMAKKARIKAEAATAAEETIGTDNEMLLDPIAALNDYY